MTNSECAAAYRKLADLLENNPEMAQPYEGSEHVNILFFCNSKEQFQATVKAFGRGKKEDGGATLDFIPDFPLSIKVFGWKRLCCEARTVTKIVPEMVIPFQPEEVIPEHEETVTEYVCSPFLEVPDAAGV